MKIFSTPSRRTFLLAAIPAALVFGSCGNNDDDDNSTPAPELGKVQLSHAAAAANVQITAFVNDVQVSQLAYGQGSAYLNVSAGAPTLRINNGSQTIVSQNLAITKDQNYSVFVYSPTSAIGSTPALLSVPDDLTAPAANQVKVRVVHLAVNAPTPVRLSVPSVIPGGAPTDLTSDVAFGAASSFVALNAGPLNLSITAAGTPRTQVLAVGDGSGTGTGTKTFEAGKIYTVLVRGISGAGVPAAQQAQAVIIQNN
ncbi:DUF4397 domain-containing protein [Hymenobacter sp. BT186]|uniref:DUF4397 domain-containing protein n=1 Tax=Hymenobacter telluris TaxID=2816474 RepID=A0A939ETA0_9BACT|nr:DUF4397 domain-containing protein [Hymenobacter telluris]MBO0357120.1 DUF4397 domain-containing protein [Hymenobacter telluris]MBW3373147.1 DUF4397 domain-containing protein [Hymenobacter norwichensis]